jgi:hypothetical protein
MLNSGERSAQQLSQELGVSVWSLKRWNKEFPIGGPTGPGAERLLSGGTKLTWGHAKKLGKPVQHIYPSRKERIFNPDSLCHEVQTLTDFLRSNKIEVLNVAGPRESKEPGVYEWTLTRLRLLDRVATGAGPKSERGE